MGGEGRGGGRPRKGGRMEKRTYRRGLQAVQRRGELVTELLQDHDYSISAAGRSLCPVLRLASVAAYVITLGALALPWPCVLCRGIRRHECSSVEERESMSLCLWC